MGEVIYLKKNNQARAGEKILIQECPTKPQKYFRSCSVLSGLSFLAMGFMFSSAFLQFIGLTLIIFNKKLVNHFNGLDNWEK